MRKFVTVALGMAVLLALAVLGVYVVRNLETRRYQMRAMAEVTVLAEAQGSFEKDNGKIAKVFEGDAWVTPDVIYFKNGDWMVYRSRCSKEDWKVRDTFIGRGSDGKWYESNFHFCVGLCVLRAEEQPLDLRSFVGRYRVKALESHP